MQGIVGTNFFKTYVSTNTYIPLERYSTEGLVGHCHFLPVTAKSPFRGSIEKKQARESHNKMIWKDCCGRGSYPTDLPSSV